MKKLLFFTFAVGILMFFLVSTANAVAFVSQERITAGEGPAQVVATSCEAIVAREEVFSVTMVRMADIWTIRSSAESSNITQTENAAPGDSTAIVSNQFIDCGRTQTLSEMGRAAPGDRLCSESKQFMNRRSMTLAEIGRAAPGICLVIVSNRSY